MVDEGFLGLFDLFRFESFYSVWYWVLVALIWFWLCYQTLGMSHGMVVRAAKRPEAQVELETIAHIQAHRFKWVRINLGPPLAAIVGFGLASIAVLGFWNRVEFFQALFMLAFPVTLVITGALRLSRTIVETEPTGAELRALLIRRRRWNQVIAILAVMLTVVVAMFYDPRSLLY